MCLSIEIHRPQDVLGSGEHSGFQWRVIHNGMGYRCGYVRVPVGHPWHGKHYDDVDADVHGSLTFAEPDEDCGKGGEDNAYWVGFDCAHYGDNPDPDLPFGRTHMRIDDPNGRVRSQEYVESQCRSLCEQAAKAAEPVV